MTNEDELNERSSDSKLHQILLRHMVTNSKPLENRDVVSTKELVERCKTK